jgi:hypothetical protein
MHFARMNDDRGHVTPHRRLRRRLVLALILSFGLLTSAPAVIEGKGPLPSRGHHLQHDRGAAIVLPLWRYGARQQLLSERRLIEPAFLPDARPAMPRLLGSVSMSPARGVETLPPHWASCHLTI